jgi:hypothetical protein
MVAARLSRRARRALAGAGLAAGAVGVAAMLAAPTAWSASVLDARYAGSSFDASAGPAGGFGPGGAGGSGGAGGRAGFRLGALPGGQAGGPAGGFPATGAGGPGGGPGGSAGGAGAGPAGVPGRYPGGGAGLALPGGAGQPGGAGGIFGSTTLSSSQQQLYRYVSAHRAGAGYLLAVQSWTEASAYILATGQEVMPMGGFSGSVPEPTLARVRQLVAAGQLRFFLLGSAGAGSVGGRGGGAALTRIAGWVRSACAVVPSGDYGPGTGGASGAGTLYDCGSRG